MGILNLKWTIERHVHVWLFKYIVMTFVKNADKPNVQFVDTCITYFTWDQRSK